MRSRSLAPVLAVLAATLLAGALRLWDLGDPPSRMFDEVYYSKAGCLFVGFAQDECGIRKEAERGWVEQYHDVGSWVHPPLGKWAIGAGELAFGPDAFGWRVSAAVAGTLTVAVVAIAVQLLFGSAVWTFAAGLLLAVENLSFVQSRIAMLDVFLAFWVVLAFLFLLLDRRWIERRTPQPEDDDAPIAVPSPLFRPWRLAAGGSLGAACATKWSGVLALAAAGLLALGWEISRRRQAGVRRPLLGTLFRESLGLVLAFLIVPAIVYVVSYADWYAHFGIDAKAWWGLQEGIADQHLDGFEPYDPKTGEPTHPYQSQPWTWLLLLRPVLYFADYPGELRKVILAVGNPVVFWLSIPAIAYIAVAWRKRRDWRAGLAIVPIVLQYAPWFFASRVQFLFYMTPIVPFLVLADTYLLRDLARVRLAGAGSAEEERGVRPFLPLAVGLVVVAVGLFAFFWPVLTGRPMTTDAWSRRMWFGDRWV